MDIYPALPTDAYALIVSDGAYGIGGFPGDPKTPKSLWHWYAPHLAAWDRLAAPSASLYFWGTPESCARMLPHVEAAGWRLYSCIRWDKGSSQMANLNHATVRGWVNSSEDCYFYVREAVDISAMAAERVYRDLDAKRRDRSAPVHMRAERESAGVTRRQVAAYFPSKSGGLTGCVTNWEEGFNFPTWEVWKRFAAALNDLAPRPADARPYLVTEAVWAQRGGLRESYEALRESYEALRESYEALREEYEAMRYHFKLPKGVTDVWRGPPVRRPGRHSCAKRDDHTRRIVEASSRRGERVLEPFGGGAPVLRACARLGRSCDSIERDPHWHSVAVASLNPTSRHPDSCALQPGLFG